MQECCQLLAPVLLEAPQCHVTSPIQFAAARSNASSSSEQCFWGVHRCCDESPGRPGTGNTGLVRTSMTPRRPQESRWVPGRPVPAMSFRLSAVSLDTKRNGADSEVDLQAHGPFSSGDQWRHFTCPAVRTLSSLLCMLHKRMLHCIKGFVSKSKHSAHLRRIRRL